MHNAHTDARDEIGHAIIPDGVTGQPGQNRQETNYAMFQFGYRTAEKNNKNKENT